MKTEASTGSTPAKVDGRVQAGKRAETILERCQQVPDLLGSNVGLLDCSRRLGCPSNGQALPPANHASASSAPQYWPTLVESYRDHLRRRRAWGTRRPRQQLPRGDQRTRIHITIPGNSKHNLIAWPR